MLLKQVAAAIAMTMGSAAATAQSIGHVGTGSANGVVTASPAGASYSYVSTFGGVDFEGHGLGLGNETNGSLYTSNGFIAQGGDQLVFHFNYVTSDGADYSDYAFAQLLAANSSLNLFTARTTTAGNTVPGFDMPALAPGVTVEPTSVGITPGGPGWDPLGSSSGFCYEAGCGYTGWVKVSYTIAEAGNYRLRFGVVNWDDTAYDSGLAWNGATLGGAALPVPEPATWALAMAGGAVVWRRLRRGALPVV